MNKEFKCPECGVVTIFDIDKVNEGLNFKLCSNDECITELECNAINGEYVITAHSF